MTAKLIPLGLNNAWDTTSYPSTLQVQLHGCNGCTQLHHRKAVKPLNANQHKMCVPILLQTVSRPMHQNCVIFKDFNTHDLIASL